MSEIRWGILGASKFARQHMGPAIHAAEGASLAGLATSDPAKAVLFRDFAPDLTVYDSYEGLLAAPHIDAVYIPLPNDMHVPWALKAIAAGKHVLVEKPAAMSVAEMDALIAARDAAGVVVAEAFMIAHHPQWAKMRALLEEGALGELRHVDGCFTYDNSADPGNIRNAAARGGGGLRDVGVYPIGAVRLATGQEPLRLTSKQISFEQGVDVDAQITAEFEGFRFCTTAGMRAMRWQFMEFHGTAGVARMTAPFNPGVYGEARIELYRPDHGTQVLRWPEGNQYVMQVEAFGRAINGDSYACPLEFSRGTQAILDDILG